MARASDSLRILVVDDNPSDRLLLSTLVQRQGHEVLVAGDGAQALALFEAQRPELVMMDAMMPVMDGFEAARRIKQVSGDTLVPIIFLTSLSEGEAVARCLEAGGDDFVGKPYNPVVVAAKINAMNRLRLLHDTMLRQRDVIARHNEHLLNEQRVAKAVFDQVAHSGCLDAPNIRYLQSPYALFNGDLLLAAYTPSGDMHMLLGDFTGHGLPAAVGAMPLAEVFYGMTAKGYGLAETLREMNAKLKRVLPVDMFCCATMLGFQFRQRQVEVWSGGLPDGYLLPAGGGARVHLVSRHLPLGVVGIGSFDDRTDMYPFGPGDWVFLLSDGVVESSNEQEERFGVSRLHQVLKSNRAPASLIDEVRHALHEFGGTARDDVSMVEVEWIDPAAIGTPVMTYSDSGASSPLDWSATFEFRASTLKRFNPLPYLLRLISEVHGLRSQIGVLYTVLSELYSNALEHGVLRLDSAIKTDAAGFSRYYQARDERLERLDGGYVRLHLHVEPIEQGGRLLIRVEDSGDGFDAEHALAVPLGKDELAGRGLRLVCALSENAWWSRDGRTACVEFRWEGLA